LGDSRKYRMTLNTKRMRELQGPTTSIGAIMNNSEAATPKFEAKRHGASDHSNNCRLVPLANILPQTLQALLKSRARDAKGNWGIWHVVSNRSYAATAAVNEYSRRFGCEEGFRDAKWWLGFTKARIAHI